MIRKTLQKLRLDDSSSYQLVPDKRLKDAWSVYVATGDGNHQFTVHHPIGICSTSDDSWVVSTPGQTHELLQNLTHPDEVRINALRRHWGMQQCVSKSLLVTQGEELYYPSDTKVSRSSHIADARRKAKEATSGGKPPDFLALLPASVVKEEQNVREFLNSEKLRKEAEEVYPLPQFETASGANCNEFQSASWIAGKNSYEAARLLRRVLTNTVKQNMDLFSEMKSKPKLPVQTSKSVTGSPKESAKYALIPSALTSPKSKKKEGNKKAK